MTHKSGKVSLLSWIRKTIDKYRKQSLLVIATMAGVVFILSQFFPFIDKFIKDSTVISTIILFIVIDIAIALDYFRTEKSFECLENQDESLPELIDAVPGCTRVDLLEYAASTTLPLIRAIQRRGVPVRILVKHPDTTTGHQKQRSITTIDTICNSIFDDYNGDFEIRCYKLPFSLRGRHLYGELLELGWLTPDTKRETAFGHNNPSCLVPIRGGRNVFLKDFFDRTFVEYWDHPDTEPAHDVLSRLSQ